MYHMCILNYIILTYMDVLAYKNNKTPEMSSTGLSNFIRCCRVVEECRIIMQFLIRWKNYWKRILSAPCRRYDELENCFRRITAVLYLNKVYICIVHWYAFWLCEKQTCWLRMLASVFVAFRIKIDFPVVEIQQKWFWWKLFL